MKQSDRNVIMITAGGVGRRFGASTPKQYLLLNGRPVIEYVIDACKSSTRADAVLVVSDPAYHEELVRTYGVDVAPNGPELNITKRNGIDYIKAHSSCEKLVVVEAVRPTLDPSIGCSIGLKSMMPWHVLEGSRIVWVVMENGL